MFKNVLSALGLGGPEHEAKILAKDARALIDMLHGQHGGESLGKIARTARTQIDVVHEKGLGDPKYYARGIVELTELNRAARARRDNIAWSGITLAIIYIKSEMLGEAADTPMNVVDGFIDRWRHTMETPIDAGSDADQ